MRYVEAARVEAGMTLNLVGDAVVELWHDDLRGRPRAKVLATSRMPDVETVSLRIEGHGWLGFRPDHAFVLARPEGAGPRPEEA